MKRYNLSQIMKSAWRKFRKGGMSFSECLKSAWKFAKIQDIFSDDNVSKRDREFANNLNEKIRNSAKAIRSSYDDLSVPSSAFYNPNSTGRYGSHYVGD